MSASRYIGIMSGTSLDAADAALVEFDGNQASLIATNSIPYTLELRQSLLELHHASPNELEKTAVVSNQLASLYADVVNQLLADASITKSEVMAIGSHGQTIRHRPELGFTIQIGNPALLAELTEMTVVADFRSRDIAAAGQGAPLVPAFHQSVFAHPNINRVIINIGGIANLSSLPTTGEVIGFDSGPGNMLMDAWAERNIGKRYDENGNWAASGKIIPELLNQLLADPYFNTAPPKSTGRDLFNLAWLEQYLATCYQAQDVQRTLLEFSVISIADAIKVYCPDTQEIYLCGGGAHNHALFQGLQHCLHPVKIGLSNELGIDINWVEAAAFAWLAKQRLSNNPGNLPAVTGASGPRILGAVYAS